MKTWWAERKRKLANENADAARQARLEKFEAEKKEWLDKKAKGLLTPVERFNGYFKFFGSLKTKMPPKKPVEQNG